MMRRCLLTLTLFTFSGWSQPAQQEAQPPPLTNPWIHLLELAVPGIIGAVSALIAVRFTNKTNERTNAANRQYQLHVELKKAEIAANYKSQDNRWTFRKDVYVNILTACNTLANSLVAVAEMQKTINLKSPGYESLLPLQQQNMSNIVRAQGDFSRYAILAPLAVADDVAPLVEIAWKQLEGGNLDDPNACDALRSKTMTLLRLTAALQTAGRKDLWDLPEPEARLKR